MKTLARMLKTVLPTTEPLNLKKFPLSGVLYRGNITPLQESQKIKQAWVCDRLGILSGFLEGYECPRCRKNEGYFAPDGCNSVFFCANSECLQDDSDSSKIMAASIREQKGLGETAKRDLELREKLVAAFGSLYHNAALVNVSIDPATREKVLSWLDTGTNFLVFAGRPGAGKTYFCASVYYWVLKKTNAIRHLPIRQYMYELKDAMAEDSPVSQESIISKYQSIKYLIIDDLGATLNTDWQKEVIFDLLDYRYQHGKQTLITTNLKYDDMCKSLGERITSRVYDQRSFLIQDWQTDKRKRPQW